MSDDFFSNVPFRQSSNDVDAPNDDFAHAISVRFGSTDLRTARLLPGDLPSQPLHPPALRQTPPSPPPPSPHPHPPPSPPHSVIAVPPSALVPYLTDPHSLVLDIRPHAAHAAARINNALSLSVPTTLLKRPLFSLSKLSQMLPSPSSRARFADWSSATRILVYDSDSTFSPDNCIIAGLLRKFRAEGFAGELGWLRGGFQAAWKEVRHLTTTAPLSPEEDDPDATSSGTLRTTHLPKAAFSLSSTTAAPPQVGTVSGSDPFPNTPAPSTFRAANPFFDTIRQNVELSHGVTERIPLRLPRRVRRRIPDLPSRWLQDIARRSAVRRSSVCRHPGLDSLESGSESSDDPHTSDPDENDPNVEEGTEALAMQFYRIELAEQRRLRSIMDHHTRESQVSAFAALAKPRRVLDKEGGALSVQTGATVPSTPHPTVFPFSITAAVEKGTKNRYTHIWPFEHARVRLHDGRHQGSHLGRRDKGKATERGRNARDRSGGKSRQREQQDGQRRSRSSPASGKVLGQEATVVSSTPSGHSYFDVRPSTTRTSQGFESEPPHLSLGPGPSVPQVKIEYDTTEQDFRTLGPPTPATALPLVTPPFYTPMEMLPAQTPMLSQPPRLLPFPSSISTTSGVRLEGAHVALPNQGLPYLGPLPSFPLRLPNRPGGLLPGIRVQARTPESLSSSAPFSTLTGRVGSAEETVNDAGMAHHPRREPSPADDYVNASYVQPLCTRKRYIATQGPLPSTYVDFWTLVWEQNVHVIVMLTREIENAMVKCGTYWTDSEYGPLLLKLLSTSPPMSPSTNPTAADISKQGFFAIREPQRKTNRTSNNQPTLITRTFLLSHISYPGVPPRKITHLQYLDWSDMNVPDDPRGVLDLVKKVEQAIAESTPGPSPSGSLSPGSASGSLSGSPSQSPDAGPDQGYDTSLLSPSSAGSVPWGRRVRRGSEWRHPELDPKSGIATFAHGKAAPVLLHCSAGVGRTGGFIAVDAVLDGIRAELRKNAEDWKPKKASRVNIVVDRWGKPGGNNMDASGELDVEGVASVESRGAEVMADENECMDVDEPTKAEKAQVSLHIINTVPIHVSAGDHMKSRRRHHNKDPSGEKQSSSQESLVVHVPYAGMDDAPEGANAAGIEFSDAKEADWQSSTREWVERVSDQTHTRAEERLLLPSPLSPPSGRERSPGSSSNSSGPSDDSMSGSAGTRSEVGNRVDRNSDTDSTSGSGAGSGSGHPPQSSTSKPESGSISLSTSGSGTGTGSRFGSSLPGARLRDSSVTSISVESTDSLWPQCEPKPSAPLHRLSATHITSVSDMEIDCPPRPVSVPLQSTFEHNAHLRHDKPPHRLSSVARFTSPLATVERSISFFGSDAAEGPTSQPCSDLGSDEVTTSPPEFESEESFGAEGGGKNGQRMFGKSGPLAVSSKSKTTLRLNTDLSAMTALKTSCSGSATENPSFQTRQTKSQEREYPLVPRTPGGSVLLKPPTTSEALGVSERDQDAADRPVIDYKLPRELHTDLSPPLISSFEDPICAIIQDMREQRMSLCQSLRQYVFVHAAIIEGALRIVDEERELWGYSGTSDEASSVEEEPRGSVGRGVRESGHGEVNAWFEGAKVVPMRSALEHGSIPPRTHPLHTTKQLSNAWSSECTMCSGRVSQAPIASSSGVPSPSKGKRAPSPTELIREDKTGALSLHKRPSIHHTRTSDEVDRFSFESRTSSSVAGESGGGLRDIVGASRSALGRLVVPERGGPESSGAR